ncbi:MAG: glycosyltransferase family 39 protein [Myxococcota bacterium]|nr:glycosyltransferase family 39 protein [Myxococcota bacterium]
MLRWTPTDEGVERFARGVVVAASLWFGLATAWGLFGRVAGGHDAVVAARAIIAENMLRWRIAGPVRQYTLHPPEPTLYYAHHPWGTFWIITAFTAALGRHAYVPRLVSVLMSTATPPLLYGVGRGLWGPVPGALSALAYVTLPITLSFGNFPGFEVPLVFACLLTTWGYLQSARRELTARRSGAWRAVSLAGVLMAVNVDWEANVFLALVLLVLTGGMFFGPPRWFDHVERRRFAQWGSLALVLAGAVGAGYVAVFQELGILEGLITGGVGRTRGVETPLLAVLNARRYWIDVTFTPLAVWVGKLALPVFLLRLLVLRRAHEVFPLALLAMALVEYVVFKNGADVHIYWPLPFAPYYALSVGVLAASGIAVWRRARAWHGAVVPMASASLKALAWVSLVPLAILPDGLEGLRYARATGGRFNERGARIFRDDDKSQALEWMTGRVPTAAAFAVHESMRPNWAQEWSLRRPVTVTSGLPGGPPKGAEERYFVSDLSFVEANDQRRLFADFAVVALGRYALVDRAVPAAPADAYSFVEREPTAWEWCLFSGVDRVRTVATDPWYTWDLRDGFAQTPNPVPSGAPRGLEQLRLAHNAAVSTGDRALAERYAEELVRQLDTRTATRFTKGITLLGTSYAAGVAPTLGAYFAAEGPADADYSFAIVSVVDQRRLLSLVPPDDRVKEVGAPFMRPTRLWKPGYIYVQESEVRHRPGLERFAGYFVGPPSSMPPQPAGGQGQVPLLTLR